MKSVQLDVDKVLPVDGSIDMIYGGLGSGKTYAATSDILSELDKGTVVFASWPVQWDGYDERTSKFKLLLGVLGLKKDYWRVDKSNFHYVPLSDERFMEKFMESTDCIWYIDEAYAIIDSYRKNKLSIQERFGIYGTRHFNRRLVLVCQRPSSVHVAARAMVNRFYKCARPFPMVQNWLRFTFFIKTMYEDMQDENVNEEKPLATKWYFGSKKVFKAYDSKYMRMGAINKYPSKVELFRIGWFSKIGLLFTRRARFSAALSQSRGLVPSTVIPPDRVKKIKVS